MIIFIYFCFFKKDKIRDSSYSLVGLVNHYGEM